MRSVAVQHEVELKFEADPDDFDLLSAHPLLREAQGEAHTQSLRSVYFDTPDHALRQAGLSLRIRTDGVARIQTIKASRDPNGVALDRDEWEHPIDSDRPDFALASGTALESLLDLRDSIQPIFAIAVQRTVLTVRRESSVVELALDRGCVEGHTSALPFAEVELELKRGEPADLFHLARSLAEAAPLRLSFAAKSDRGFGAMVDPPNRVKAEPVALKKRMASADAFQAITSSCLRHLMANDSILRSRREPEAVHQMRVALRRLRAAITLFKGVVADARRDAIRGELKWMAGQLGEARDLDVYIAQTLEPARDRHREDKNFEALLSEYEGRRRKAYEVVQATIVSPRFVRGILEAAAWFQTGEWLSPDGKRARLNRDKPVVEHAEEELARRWRKIRKGGKQLSSLDPEERHRLRIEIKKVRYATEFFESLFTGSSARKRKRAARDVLEALQETLGELNDIAVGSDLGASPAAETLRREQLARVDDLLASAEDQYRAFTALKPFWTAK